MPQEEKLTFKRCRALLDRLLDRLQAVVGEDLLAVALFGSVARGEGGRTSDLDLLIVHRGQERALLDRFVQLLRELRGSQEYRALEEAGYLPDPSPVFLTEERLNTHPWLLLDVQDHGVILLDRDGVLRRELERIRERLEDLGSRRVVLPDGTWYWDLQPDWKPGDVIEL